MTGAARRMRVAVDGGPVERLLSRASTVTSHCQEVRLTTLAGNLAFRMTFAAFPTLIAVLWLLRAAHADEFARSASDVLGMIVPGVAHAPLKEQAGSAPEAETRRLTLGIAASLLVSVWAISEFFRSALQALNAISGFEETRSGIRRVALTVLAAVGTLICFAIALAVIVSGSRLTWSLADSLGLASAYRWLWGLIAWLVVAGFVWLGFSLVYEVGPARRQPVRLIRAGSLMAVALWIVFSAAFALYANYLSKPQETYGALAGVAFLMIYSYGSALALLLGAELNRQVMDDDRCP